MRNNSVKIKSNPYTKHIEYSYKDEYESWVPSAKLSSDKFTNIMIQDKLYEIIQEIQNSYNPGNKGLELIFEGTEEDYNDVCAALKYFPYYRIGCCKGELNIDSAEKTMPAIKAIFDELDKVFKSYPDDQISKEIAKFSEAIKPTVAVCVMGLYSSGKSTFINSLIGEELLPSSSDPTTAKNYKITTSSEAKIKFQYDQETIELTFDQTEYFANKPGELDIIQELQKAIDSDERKTQISHMHTALEIINKYDNERDGEQHVSTLVEVFVPFQNSRLPLDQFDFCIYDTPGSDSIHPEHLEVLKESLQGQTNGLPIFVTTPDEMEKKENDKIVKIIEEMGEALDQTGTIVVVNKADEKVDTTLDKKKENASGIIMWHSSRVFFVSSIMGLGSKKVRFTPVEEWIDDQNKDVFEEKEEKFGDLQNRKYKQLYKYNFLPESRMNQITEEAEKITEQAQNTEMPNLDLIYLNSGIMAVEEEIGIFAHKYALYNKCRQARQYLEKAIELAEQKSKAAEATRYKLEQSLKGHIDGKKKVLIGRLEEVSKKAQGEINGGYSVEMGKLWPELTNDIEGLKKEIGELWQTIKKGISDEKERNKAIEREVNKKVKEFGQNFKSKFDKWSGQYWKKATQKYKDECCRVILESAELTKEQKDFLCAYVMEDAGINVELVSINMREERIIRDRRLLFFKIGEQFKLKKCEKWLTDYLTREMIVKTQGVVDRNRSRFLGWANQLDVGFKGKIASFNPTLARLTGELEYCRKEMERLNIQEDLLSSKKDELNTLLDFYKEG